MSQKKKKEFLQQQYEYLNDITLNILKNYQAWNFRRLFLHHFEPTLAEREFLDDIFAKDQKHMFAWSHRRWLFLNMDMFLSSFSDVDEIKEDEKWKESEDASENSKLSFLLSHEKYRLFLSEMKWTDNMLSKDPKNNSALSYKIFLIKTIIDLFKKKFNISSKDTDHSHLIISEHIKEAAKMWNSNPHSEALYRYLLALLEMGDEYGIDLDHYIRQLQEMATSAISIDLYNSIAMEALVFCSTRNGDIQEAKKHYASLKLIDPIRSSYWDWKFQRLDVEYHQLKTLTSSISMA